MTEKCQYEVGTKLDPKRAGRAGDREWEPILVQAHGSRGTDDETNDGETPRLKLRGESRIEKVKVENLLSKPARFMLRNRHVLLVYQKPKNLKLKNNQPSPR